MVVSAICWWGITWAVTMRVNIIGGGLAGCSLAYVLKQAGAEPIIYEAGDGVASGASGNAVGLYNPRFSAQYDAVGEFYSTAYFEALKIFDLFGDDIDWRPCGALHLMCNDQKRRRFPKAVDSWGWSSDDMRLVDSGEASALAGVDVDYACLYLPRAGTVSPRKLCQAYVRGVEVRCNSHIQDLSALDGDVTILACGFGALSFPQAAYLPLKPVRGQVSYVRSEGELAALKVALCYGGYITPSMNGAHCVGATFERNTNHGVVQNEDDVANLEQLSKAVPEFSSALHAFDQWAGVRCASRDHFPVVGALGQGGYVSSGHGSHGVLSSLLSAKILSNSVLNTQKQVVSSCVADALSPERFR